jgi:two-component system, sporulation sensor kinase E
VAHEIGNPLNALHIHLQLMERELGKLGGNIGEPAERELKRDMTGARGRSRTAPASPNSSAMADSIDRLATYLGVCKGEIARLDYTVTQFLQAIRPSPPQFREVCVNDVVHEAVELLRPETENRGIAIREKLARQVPVSSLDPAQIKQVLVNLIKNAIQAMTKGGVLTLETTVSSDGVVLSVGDTGGGIPSDQINRIFEPFFTTKKKGSGLGLMIVRRIVRDHGGHINIESHVGKGTVFRVWLPLLEPQPKLISARHD